MVNKTIENARILKGIGGFYYVVAAGAVYEGRARGIFRKEGVTPLAGGPVTVTLDADPQSGNNTIDRIEPRRNFFLRPPVANIDRLFITVSAVQPRPNYLLIDRLTAIAVYKHVEPVIVITKGDLAPVDDLVRIYRSTGLQMIVSDGGEETAEAIRSLITGKVAAFTGNSGVGKSTLINLIAPELNLDTAQISQKLGRGRHTTRTAELFRVADGYVVDTPGFSSLDFSSGERIPKEELATCFPEFVPFLAECRFTSCSHTTDRGCGVLRHLEAGEIDPSRHQSYVQLYQEVKDIKQWQK